MKLRLLSLLLISLTGSSLCAQFIWTGAGSTDDVTLGLNWQGGVAPTGSGTENLTFGDIPTVAQTVIVPTSGFAVDNLKFTGAGRPAYSFVANSSTPTAVLTLGGDASLTAPDSSASVVVENSLNLALTAGSHTVGVSNGLTTVNFQGSVGENGGSASIVKNGAGTLVLSGNNTYTGGTTLSAGSLDLYGTSLSSTITVNAGTLTLHGNHINSNVAFNGGSISLQDGASLAGNLNWNNGTISGNGTIAASTAVANSRLLYPLSNGAGIANTLNFGGDLTFDNGGKYQWLLNDVGAGPGTGWGYLNIAGRLTISATALSPFTINISGAPELNFNNTQAYSWAIASAAGGITGFSASAFTLDLSSFGYSLGNGSFLLSQSGTDLSLNFTPVPEPSTWVLLGVGLVLVVARNRRRRHD